jgi:hypothetical protein
MPGCHLGAIHEATAPLMAHVVAPSKTGALLSFRERSATADVAPHEWRSGPMVHSLLQVSTIGCSHLRQAIYVLTTSVVWHEPTCSSPCVQRMPHGPPLFPPSCRWAETWPTRRWPSSKPINPFAYVLRIQLRRASRGISDQHGIKPAKFSTVARGIDVFSPTTGRMKPYPTAGA